MTESRQSKMTNVLLSLLATGFIAWAAVVWDASQDVTGTVSKIFITLGVIEQKLDYLQRDLSDHEKLPWHGDVGLQLERLRNNHER